MMKQELIVVAGPTGTGKTKFVRENFSPETNYLINADSMQVYKEISIGNNKELPSEFEFELIDFLKPTQSYSVADFIEQFNRIISKRDGKTPILVGGSGMYINSVLSDYNFQKYSEDLSGLSVEELKYELNELKFDLTQLNESEINNKRRLENLLKRLNANSDSNQSSSNNFQTKLYIADLPQEELDKKLKLRVEEMLKAGFVNEVKSLISKYSHEKIAPKIKSAAGYKQILAYLEGEISKEDLPEKIFRSHRQLSIRQRRYVDKYLKRMPWIGIEPTRE